MDESNATRKPTAVYCAGVAGCSCLTGADDLGIHRALMGFLDYVRVWQGIMSLLA